MPRKLDFKALIPERDVFQDIGGQEYEFRVRSDFGAVENARIRRLEKEFSLVMDALGNAPDDEAMAQRFEAMIDEFAALILPGLPVERRKEMTFGQKTEIISWWTEQQKKLPVNGAVPEGEAQANQSATP